MLSSGAAAGRQAPYSIRAPTEFHQGSPMYSDTSWKTEEKIHEWQHFQYNGETSNNTTYLRIIFLPTLIQIPHKTITVLSKPEPIHNSKAYH